MVKKIEDLFVVPVIWIEKARNQREEVKLCCILTLH